MTKYEQDVINVFCFDDETVEERTAEEKEEKSERDAEGLVESNIVAD